MEIKLFEAADKKKSFTFSSLPEKISGSLGTKYQTCQNITTLTGWRMRQGNYI